MPQFTSGLDLYRHQKAAFERAAGSARQVWRQIPEGGYRDLKELTSGGLSSATLRRMGHPYGKSNRFNGGKSAEFVARGSKLRVKINGRSVRLKAPLLPINRQSGRLQGSVTLWHRSDAYSLEASVGFDAGKAGKSILTVRPGGTRYVVPRGIWVELRRRGRARNKAFMDTFPTLQHSAFAQI